MSDISIFDNMSESMGQNDSFSERGYNHTWTSPQRLSVELEDYDDVDTDSVSIKSYADELAVAMGEGWSADAPRVGDQGGLIVDVSRPRNPGE